MRWALEETTMQASQRRDGATTRGTTTTEPPDPSDCSSSAWGSLGQRPAAIILVIHHGTCRKVSNANANPLSLARTQVVHWLVTTEHQ